MYVGPPFVPKAESAELTKPCKGSFYHPPPSAQPATMFGVAHREQRCDVPGSKTLPDCLRVITTVA